MVNSPTAHGGQGDEGRRYLEDLGVEGLERLRQAIISSLGSFRRFSQAALGDLADEAIFRALRSGHLDPEQQPVAYIKKIAYNLAVKQQEKLRNEDFTGDNAEMPSDTSDATHHSVPQDDPQSWTRVDDEELVARVEQAITKIPAQQTREVTRLRARGGTPEEVAAQLDIPRHQVDQQYYRGKKAVRSMPEVQPFIREAYLKAGQTQSKQITPAEDGD